MECSNSDSRAHGGCTSKPNTGTESILIEGEKLLGRESGIAHLVRGGSVAQTVEIVGFRLSEIPKNRHFRRFPGIFPFETGNSSVFVDFLAENCESESDT